MRWDDPLVVAATITVSATITLAVIGWVVTTLVGRPGNIANLAAQVIATTKEVGELRSRIEALEAANETLQERLDVAQERFAAAIAYVAELIRWVEGGAHAPVPQPGAMIAQDIILPASWLHPIIEDPE